MASMKTLSIILVIDILIFFALLKKLGGKAFSALDYPFMEKWGFGNMSYHLTHEMSIFGYLLFGFNKENSTIPLNDGTTEQGTTTFSYSNLVF